MNEKKTRESIFSYAFAVVGTVIVMLGSTPVAGAAIGPGGGLPVPPPPTAETVLCLTGCSNLRTSSVGGTVQIGGKTMSSVRWVSFAGEAGRVRTEPVSVGPTSVVARIPAGATTGRVRVVSTGSSSASTTREVLNIKPKPRGGNPGSPLVLTDASTSPERVYLYGKSKPRIDFVVAGGDRSSPVRIDVLNGKGSVVASRLLADLARNSSASFTWNLKTVAGRDAGGGRYRFRILDQSGEPAELAPRLRKSSPAATLGFTVNGYMFPVRGAHSYGDGIGAGRGHQGGDVAAACGTPLVAARGGRVHYNSYQASGAGHYVVINIAGTGNQSHVYMHLERPSPAKVGSFVRTGQKIGTVGTTGRSTGCHLHFEHWSAPGWYQGGTFLDPMANLRKWDAYS